MLPIQPYQQADVNTREVYEFKFYRPIDNTFGRLSIAAQTEWTALMQFNKLDGLIFKGQQLTKFI
jgi:hypothetical protein